MATSPSRRPATQGKNRWGRVHCQKSGSEDRGRRRTGPGRKRLFFGGMEHHLTDGEGVRACVEGRALPVRSGGAHFHAQRPHCDQTPGYSRGWTLFFSGMIQGMRRWVGVGIFTSPWLSAATLEFILVDKSVASLRLRDIGGEIWPLFVPMQNKQTVVQNILPFYPAGRVQCIRGQWWRYLEGWDWEERPP